MQSAGSWKTSKRCSKPTKNSCRRHRVATHFTSGTQLFLDRQTLYGRVASFSWRWNLVRSIRIKRQKWNSSRICFTRTSTKMVRFALIFCRVIGVLSTMWIVCSPRFSHSSQIQTHPVQPMLKLLKWLRTITKAIPKKWNNMWRQVQQVWTMVMKRKKVNKTKLIMSRVKNE